jgi:hypothetical protein
MAWAAWGKASPAAAVVTFRVRRSVRPCPLGIRHRHVAPGQVGELGVRAGLVALDDQQVVRAASGQVGGVLALGMQGIGGDDRAGDVDAVQQRGEHGDFVDLASTSTWPKTIP